MAERMQLRFYIDPETGAPHIYRHRVSEAEVEEVLANASEDRRGVAGARVAMGRTLNGRLLRVAYVPDPEPESYFVIYSVPARGQGRIGIPTS